MRSYWFAEREGGVSWLVDFKDLYKVFCFLKGNGEGGAFTFILFL